MGPFASAPKKNPTKKHRPAIWECVLGTVYAMNDDGVVKYFDYDYETAHAYSGIAEEGRDPRLAKFNRNVSYGDSGTDSRKGQLVVWVLKK